MSPIFALKSRNLFLISLLCFLWIDLVIWSTSVIEGSRTVDLDFDDTRVQLYLYSVPTQNHDRRLELRTNGEFIAIDCGLLRLQPQAMMKSGSEFQNSGYLPWAGNLRSCDTFQSLSRYRTLIMCSSCLDM